jgi:hypothetical protein
MPVPRRVPSVQETVAVVAPGVRYTQGTEDVAGDHTAQVVPVAFALALT